VEAIDPIVIGASEPACVQASAGMRIFNDAADQGMAAVPANGGQDAHVTFFVANDEDRFIQDRYRQVVAGIRHLVDVRYAQPLPGKYGVLLERPELLADVGFWRKQYLFLARKPTKLCSSND